MQLSPPSKRRVLRHLLGKPLAREVLREISAMTVVAAKWFVMALA